VDAVAGVTSPTASATWPLDPSRQAERQLASRSGTIWCLLLKQATDASAAPVSGPPLSVFTAAVEMSRRPVIWHLGSALRGLTCPLPGVKSRELPHELLVSRLEVASAIGQAGQLDDLYLARG